MWDYLPVLLLLACPLMMIFMMRGMGGMNHSNSQPHDDGTSDPAQGIATLEAEVAAMRAQQQQQPVDRDWARSS